MDHVSTWGYVYGYIGGVIIMIVHLGMIAGIGSEPWVFSVVFITSGALVARIRYPDVLRGSRAGGAQPAGGGRLLRAT